MSDATRFDRGAKGRAYVILADELVEAAGSVCSR
jgi:hypothetical protein